MDNVIEKMAKFKVDCISQAKKDADELREKMKEQIEAQVTEEMEGFNVRQELKFNRNMKKVEKEFYANCYALESEANQKIIQKKEELKEDFKNSLQNIIIEFVKSDNYEDYLKKSIKNALSKMNIDNNKNITIYITNNDKIKFEDRIKKDYPEIHIGSIDDEFLGGCKCYSKIEKIFIDNTLKLAIDEQVANRRW